MAVVSDLASVPYRIPGLLDGVSEVLEGDPDLAPLRDAGDGGLLVMHPRGGTRITLSELPGALLGSALAQRFLGGVQRSLQRAGQGDRSVVIDRSAGAGSAVGVGGTRGDRVGVGSG
jgi:hypothetical protein